MGIFDTFTDMLEAALPWSEARAEAAEAEEKDDEKVCFFCSFGDVERCGWVEWGRLVEIGVWGGEDGVFATRLRLMK